MFRFLMQRYEYTTNTMFAELDFYNCNGSVRSVKAL